MGEVVEFNEQKEVKELLDVKSNTLNSLLEKAYDIKDLSCDYMVVKANTEKEKR